MTLGCLVRDIATGSGHTFLVFAQIEQGDN
jgi:hypothetical protein